MMRLKNLLSALVIAVACLSSTVHAAEFEMISYSAQVKLQWLAAAGIPDAVIYNQLLNKRDFFNRDNLNDFDRIEKVNAIYNDFCYASFIDFVKANNYQNVYEIGCSYSPRVVALAKAGCNYVGAELSAVALVADDLARRVLDKRYHHQFAYFDAPVVDRAAMLDSANFLNGKVCVIEQGLMIYFNRDQIAGMLENIKAILHQHGGCFVTSNFVRKDYFADIVTPIYGAGSVDDLYFETKSMYEGVLGDPMYDDTFSSKEDAIAFLNGLGFEVKEAPLFTEEPELDCFKGLTDEQIGALKTLGRQKYIWVLTLKG
ncbi:MAG: hypothetical protein IJU71_03745 [Selenomonadaceae bacterium]|nr:hypothetical protein [Selenomonadaceae bacterium]